jgi:hypothetical protein
MHCPRRAQLPARAMAPSRASQLRLLLALLLVAHAAAATWCVNGTCPVTAPTGCGEECCSGSQYCGGKNKAVECQSKAIMGGCIGAWCGACVIIVVVNKRRALQKKRDLEAQQAAEQAQAYGMQPASAEAYKVGSAPETAAATPPYAAQQV